MMQPSKTLIDACNRLLTIERSRIRESNATNSMLRRELGVRTVAEIPKEIRIPSNPAFVTMEKQAVKTVEHEVKDSPYAEFIDLRNGIAAKSFGRLWAIIGDPASYVDRFGEPQDRTIGQLFQYCRVGDPDNKRRAGTKLVGNPKAGPRLHVIAENAGVKVSGAYYRSVYDAARSDAEGRLHTGPCSPCGTKSEAQREAQKLADEQTGGLLTLKNDVPAGVGAPWRPGHIHGHALRQVKREFLRDLYDFTLALTL